MPGKRTQTLPRIHEVLPGAILTDAVGESYRALSLRRVPRCSLPGAATVTMLLVRRERDDEQALIGATDYARLVVRVQNPRVRVRPTPRMRTRRRASA